jgi:hypothetical protein
VRTRKQLVRHLPANTVYRICRRDDAVTVAFSTGAIIGIWRGPCVVVEPMRSIGLVDMMNAVSVDRSRGGARYERSRE